MAAAFFQHFAEALPGFRRRMLPAKFALAVAPATGGDDRGDPLVRASGVDRDGGPEAAADETDAPRGHLWTARHVSQGVRCVFDLIEAEDAGVLAAALAAASKIDAHDDVAPCRQLLRNDALPAA